MGEAAKTASDGGANSGVGGAGRARALRLRRGPARPAAQHTAAGRRVRTRRTPTVTSPLSASRADEKQLPAATEQVRERRAGVGGAGGGGAGAALRGQEGRAAAEGHALVPAHGRAAGGGRGGRGGGRRALRHGAARAAAARQLTAPRRRRHPPAPYHAYIPLSGRSDSPARPRVPEYYRLGIYLFGARPAVP